MRKGVMIGLTCGFVIGLIGVGYCWYITLFDIGDGGEGALAFLFIFGFPASLLQFPLEYFVTKTFIMNLASESILFMINWSLIGYLVGLGLEHPYTLLQSIIEANKSDKEPNPEE